MLSFGLFAGAATPGAAAAYASGCASAEANVRASRAALQRAIDDYSACVARSDGHDDCAAAFRKLRAVQSTFATAVADLRGSCPPE